MRCREGDLNSHPFGHGPEPCASAIPPSRLNYHYFIRFTIISEGLLRGRLMAGHLPLEQGILGSNPSPAAKFR